MKKHSVMLACKSENIFSRVDEFGEREDDTEVQFDEDFYMEMFMRTIKIAGLDKNIYFYSEKNLPLLFKTNIGHLGSIYIYFKSISQIEQ